MKKLLITCILVGTALSTMAKENITILYAYGAGDSVANYHRTLTAEANKLQDKYNFVFDARPGAGGAIASNHVLATPNTILAHSTAFFVRPNVYPNESYDLTQFKEQYVHCMAPMAITSSKYKSWKEVPVTATVGISGLGVTTHLASLQIKEKFKDLNIIPFKSTTESMLSMVSGQTDLHIGFISEAEQWGKENTNNPRKVYVLGITGTKSVNGYPTMVSEGFSSSFGQMDVGHHLVIPAKIDDVKAKEFYDIFAKAAKTEAVRAAYAVDYCVPQSVSYTENSNWFKFHTEFWKKLSAGVKLQ